MYLDKVLSLPARRAKGGRCCWWPVPITGNEARSLAGLVAAAFPSAGGFDIWFKGIRQCRLKAYSGT